MTNNNPVRLLPTEIQGSVNIPPSKSLSHRALICAGLSNGRSKISNIIYSEDIKATISALEQLGAEFEAKDDEITVTGVKRLKYDNNPVDCNESGSTIRFMIPIFSLTNKEITFVGKESLINRPQSIYENIFKEDGNKFTKSNNKIVVKGSVKSRDYHIDGNVSSQFISGLMFSLPLLNDDSTIHINGKLESKGYIDLTVDMLETFGIEIQETTNGYFIPGNQKYEAKDYRVEGDYSQAAFFLVGGILNGAIKINDLNHESFQGDKEIVDIIKRMKGKVIYTENGFATNKSSTIGTTIDISTCPDLGPIVSLLGTLSKGTTTITNISRLRLKESDRVESTVCTLKALGADIKVTNDTIVINGRETLMGGVTVDSYNDHRIAMMISIAALRCEKEVILTGANAVNKSYPHFFKDYKLVGGSLIIKD